MSVVDIDREERRSARIAAQSTGRDVEHDLDCHCRPCLRNRYDPAEDR